MKLFLFLFSIVVNAKASPLTVYTYDSLVGKHSLGALLGEEFEKKYHEKIQWVPFGSGGEALNQVKLESGSPKADVLIGFDNSFLPIAKASDLVENISSFDYGYLAFVYDERKTKEIPQSLKDFSSPKFKKKVALEDPRTSSIGLGFLIWTHSQFKGESNRKFWKDFSRSVLTYSPGWSGTYGLFLKGEAAFALSYTTSPAYHIEKEKNDSIKAVLFPEGHYKQEEYVALVKSSKNRELAQKFVELLLSKEIQEKIPAIQWMYPVNEKVSLPKSFGKLKIPRAIKVDMKGDEKEVKGWLSDWSLNMVKAQ